MSRQAWLGALVFLLSASPGGYRQQPPPPLELLYAGRSEHSRQTGVTVQRDSVLYRQGDQYVLADMATFLDRQEQVRLQGNVRGWDPEWEFRADEVLYRARERTLLATGNVVATRQSDGMHLRAAQVHFDRGSGEGRASGSPYLYQPPQDSTGHATEVVGREASVILFHEDQGWAEVSGGATVLRGGMTVVGRLMRSQGDPRILVVREEVRLLREGVEARGEYLYWDEDEGLARLRGSPPVLERAAAREEGSLDSVFTTMTADSLDMRIREDALESLLMYGKGRVELRTVPAPPADPDSTAVPERMRLDGTDISMRFQQDRLTWLEAKRAAMYYWREDAPDHDNALGGLTLTVEFADGEPSVVTSKGNATTRYFKDPQAPSPEMERAQGALIRLTMEDGALKTAYLEDADARHYSAEMIRLGVVPMAVHPDSIQVGATRPARARTGRPPPTQEQLEGTRG